jgi:hypothetical protein
VFLYWLINENRKVEEGMMFDMQKKYAAENNGNKIMPENPCNNFYSAPNRQSVTKSASITGKQ